MLASGRPPRIRSSFMFTEVGPHLFMGGRAADYVTFIGPKGTWCTQYIKTGKTIQSVVPAGGSVLPILGLAVNILNLGVSLYSVYQTRKVRGELAALKTDVVTGFAETHRLLQRQGECLAILADRQQAMDAKLSLLHQSMEQGFDSVHDRLLDREALQLQEDFERLTRKLLSARCDLGEALSVGTPPANQLSRIIDAADDLQAWVQTKLSRSKAGDPARLPWLMASALACRVLVDGRRLEAGDASLGALQLQELVATIRGEIFALCTGRSVYEIAVPLHDVIEQYVLLYRAFTTEGEWLEIAGETSYAFRAETALWNDGLDELRDIFSRSPAESGADGRHSIELHTIADYDWFCAWAGRDPATLDVHSVRSVTLGEITKKIGYPVSDKDRFALSDVAALKQLSMPATLADLGGRLAIAANLPTRPLLVDPLLKALAELGAAQTTGTSGSGQVKAETLSLRTDRFRKMRRIKIEHLRAERGQLGYPLDLWRRATGGWRASLLDWDGGEIARFEVDEQREKDGPVLALHTRFDTKGESQFRPTEIKMRVDWSNDPPDHVNLELSSTFGKTQIWAPAWFEIE